MIIEEIRKEIDEVDDKLLDLFLQRMTLSEKIAAYKISQNLPILNTAREEEILNWAEKASPQYAEFTRAFFSALFSLSRKRQEQILNTALHDSK